MAPVKLNLGSGDKPIDGYINKDIKDGASAWPLAVEDGSADEIRASHILEHFSHRDTFDVIKHWTAKLKPGGTLKIAVPDFGTVTKRYLAGEKLNVLGYICGSHSDEHDYHKAVFDESSLREILTAAGLEEIESWQNDDVDDCASMDISLNLKAKKPRLKTKTAGPDPDIITGTAKLGCVISMPRLGFTDNVKCMIRELAMRGVVAHIGQGAYWSQVMSNLIEDVLREGCDYVLTLDYDTWFTWDMVKKMVELAETTQADCIIPMQKKRGCDNLLVGAEKNQISRAEYESGLFEVTGGHFGCTLFNAKSFAQLDKPWFKAIPAPNGSWREGRIDADIYFWQNAARAGWKMYLATKVKIAHMELMANFPGTFDTRFKPVFVDIADLDNGNIPEYIINDLED